MSYFLYVSLSNVKCVINRRVCFEAIVKATERNKLHCLTICYDERKLKVKARGF